MSINKLNMRFPGGKPKCLTISYDDGVEQDIRLVELMKKYNIAGTFNINSGNYAAEGTVFEKGRVHRRMTLNKCLETYKSTSLVEVATHAYTHVMPDKVPCAYMVNEIITDRLNLEKQFGTIIRGHAYPYGAYNADVTEALRLCGLVYARTTKSTFTFDIPQNWLVLNPTCHHKELEQSGIADKFINKTPEYSPWLFYLWGHSYEFEKDGNWNVIEEFFEKVSNREDIWYATNIDVYDYVQAFNSLIYSADATVITNPTSTDVWVTEHKKGTQCIPAGKTVHLL